jgi:molybdopterin/thiamine biosynthesis adenylyltransferase
VSEERKMEEANGRNGDFLEKLKYKVLVVGAGRIGCELLKNLALTGFSNIEVVSLFVGPVESLGRQARKPLMSATV